MPADIDTFAKQWAAHVVVKTGLVATEEQKVAAAEAVFKDLLHKLYPGLMPGHLPEPSFD